MQLYFAHGVPTGADPGGARGAWAPQTSNFEAPG